MASTTNKNGSSSQASKLVKVIERIVEKKVRQVLSEFFPEKAGIPPQEMNEIASMLNAINEKLGKHNIPAMSGGMMNEAFTAMRKAAGVGSYNPQSDAAQRMREKYANNKAAQQVPSSTYIPPIEQVKQAQQYYAQEVMQDPSTKAAMDLINMADYDPEEEAMLAEQNRLMQQARQGGYANAEGQVAPEMVDLSYFDNKQHNNIPIGIGDLGEDGGSIF